MISFHYVWKRTEFIAVKMKTGVHGYLSDRKGFQNSSQPFFASKSLSYFLGGTEDCQILNNDTNINYGDVIVFVWVRWTHW